MTIIGLTGPMGAGQGTVAGYYKEKGHEVIILSDILREEAKKNNIMLTRENLQNLGNNIRSERGIGALAVIALERMSGKENFVISSIRNPGEVEALRKTKKFFLISIDAPREFRVDRILKRYNETERKEDPITREAILARMNRDEGEGEAETGQQVKKCMIMADYHIFNDKSVEDLKDNAEKIFNSIQSKRKRPSWDEYFMAIAWQASKRATCDRKHVGSVIVREKNVLATGYNGSIRGFPHCDDVGHMIEEGHCVATVHAEANAIVQAAKNGVNINGSTLYTSASPCWSCFKMIANSGVKRIVYGELYRDERIKEFAEKAGIELVPLY